MAIPERLLGRIRLAPLVREFLAYQFILTATRPRAWPLGLSSTFSCGWGRECSSRWAAESAATLHPRLSTPGIEHTITIEDPPSPDAPRQPELPLA